jgi:hypothetical protein
LDIFFTASQDKLRDEESVLTFLSWSRKWEKRKADASLRSA